MLLHRVHLTHSIQVGTLSGRPNPLRRTDMSVPRPSILVAIVLLGLPACTPTHKDPCSRLQVGDPTAAVVLLTDRPSGEFAQAVDGLAKDATRAFSDPALGGTKPGVVVLANYDAQGHVTTRGTFNLAGVGPTTTDRQLNALTQARCLRTAAATVTSGSSADLLRALSDTASTARRLAPKGPSTIVAFGLGRSSSSGFTVANTDLSTPKARAHVLDELTRVGLLPNLGGSRLVIDAPGESASNGIASAAIESFTGDLCQRLQPTPCTYVRNLT